MRSTADPGACNPVASPEGNLARLAAAHRTELEALAEAWLAMGARAFGLSEGDRAVAVWPNGAALDAGFDAPVTVETATIGQLHVAGLRGHAAAGSVAEMRLAADAVLVSHLAASERQLDALAEELVEAQDQLLALYDLGRASRKHLTLAETLDSLCREIARLIRCDGAALHLAPPDGPPASATYALDAAQVRALRGSLANTIAAEREVLLTGTAAQDLAQGGCALVMPLRVYGKSGGALALVRDAGSPPLASPDIKLARALAEQAGAQIENVLLYEEMMARTRLETEMAVARSVQMRLLPTHAPNAPGLALYARGVPALQVGGDYYDFLASPTRDAGGCRFTVGDVTGKGMPAALGMAMVRAAMRAAARAAVRDRAGHLPAPAQLLERANAELYDDFSDIGMFVSAFVASYDHTARALTYANAGHSPIIYCPPGGEARLLEADGPGLCVLPFSICADHVAPFDPGTILVAATDGFPEASNHAGELFGYERLLRLVESLASQPVEAIADGLFAAVAAFAAGHLQEDDRTLVVAKGVVS